MSLSKNTPLPACTPPSSLPLPCALPPCPCLNRSVSAPSSHQMLTPSLQPDTFAQVFRDWLETDTIVNVCPLASPSRSMMSQHRILPVRLRAVPSHHPDPSPCEHSPSMTTRGLANLDRRRQDVIPEHDEYRAMPHSLRHVLVRPLPLPLSLSHVSPLTLSLPSDTSNSTSVRSS